MSDQKLNVEIVTFCGQYARVACDRKCSKAWGMHSRPKIQLSENPDDYAFLADSELGEAPIDPGTYEGADAKPLSPDQFPNKWCVRECERCSMSEPGKWRDPVVIKSFETRQFNIPQSNQTKNV